MHLVKLRKAAILMKFSTIPGIVELFLLFRTIVAFGLGDSGSGLDNIRIIQRF